jgi:hypothetical protein
MSKLNERPIPVPCQHQTSFAEHESRGQEAGAVGSGYFSILEEQAANQLEMTHSMGPKTVLLITGTGIGQGDQQLASILMSQFLFNLTRLEDMVRCILFVNSGVFLVTEGSDVLPHLHVLQERGAEIISSITCLEHYQLTDKMQIGSTANLFTITEKLMDSLRVITL